ncbi:MAG: DUF2726 domain-containing protein [Chloroflexales bacterium]
MSTVMSPELIGAGLCLFALFCVSVLLLWGIRVIIRAGRQWLGRCSPNAGAVSARVPTAVRSAPIPAIDRDPYIRQPALLTHAERDFFAVLRAAAPPGWYVFPQVRLANLVTPRKGTHNWQMHFNKIAAKCVDFVLCDAEAINPQLVVELDDSSHDRADRQARDAFVDAALWSAGLPILHVRWRPRYDAEDLAVAIRRAVGQDLPRGLPTSENVA